MDLLEDDVGEEEGERWFGGGAELVRSEFLSTHRLGPVGDDGHQRGLLGSLHALFELLPHTGYPEEHGGARSQEGILERSTKGIWASKPNCAGVGGGGSS